MDPFQTKITFSGLKISCTLMGIFGESKNTLDFKSKDVSGQEILDFTLILFQPENSYFQQIQNQEEKQKKDNLLKSKKERAERRQKSKQELDVQHQIGVENIIESGIASLNNSLSHQDSAAVLENSKDIDTDNNLQQQQLIKNNSTSILNDSLNQNFSQNLQIPQHKRTTSSNNNYPKKQLSQQNQAEEINKIEKEKQDWKDKFLASEKKNVQIQTQLSKLQEVFQKQVNENSQLKKNIHELNQEKKNWKINEKELKMENDNKKQQDLNSQNDEKQRLLNQIQVLEQKFNENQKTMEAKNASINNYKDEIKSVRLQIEELNEQIKLLKNENEKIKTEKEDEISNITEIFNSQSAKSNDQRKQYQDLENQVKEQLQQIKENKNQEIKQLQAQLDNIDEIQAKKQEQKTVLLRERIQQLSLDNESLKKQNQKDIELIKNQQKLEIQKIQEQKLVLESQIDYLKKFVLNKYHLNEEQLNQEIDEYVKFDQQGDSSIARELITRGNQENNLSSSQIVNSEINQKNSNQGIKTRPNKKFNKYNTILKNQHNLKQQENQINDKLQQQNFQNMIKANIYQLNPQETEQDELKKENHAGDQKYFKYEYTEIIIKFLDLDKDGYLNYQEFLKALKI
ncbi:hypothetical protein PPERSA_06659 [Pseudocohnilembus persalinus]|uniref:EF-hand domain-containing protein n=1 Tax=Pseudocohnilembus persalinus TaxID=266149 RepID=A0A0V0QS77_PSEPJ|nr:hypothetical protein PPERSA_06659 [Pseudocohnilembus persalinus]|eukprot:KRX05025.1 hypothetical protein PPERSA_06659 [Pseudocohnilembus persalinus]